MDPGIAPPRARLDRVGAQTASLAAFAAALPLALLVSLGQGPTAEVPASFPDPGAQPGPSAPPPVARWVAGSGVEPGISNLVGSWSAVGAAGLVASQPALRSWPRLDVTLAAGRSALVFDGNDSLVAPDALPLGSASRALAVRVDDVAAGGVLVGAVPGDAVRVLAGSGVLAYEQGGAAILAQASLEPGTFHVIVTIWDEFSGKGSLYLDGLLVGVGLLPPPADAVVGLGGSKYGGLPLTGAIAEARLYAHALSGPERLGVEAQLAVYQDPAFPAVELAGLPRDAQVLQRDAQDTAQVLLQGVVHTPGYDQVILKVLRDGLPYATRSLSLSYGPDGAPFTLAVTLAAGLFDHEISVAVRSGAETRLVVRRRNVCVGDAFLVDGQSNAVARDWKAEELGDDHQSHWVRSFGDAQWITSYGPPPVVSHAKHALDLNWDVARSHVAHDHATVGQWALRMAEALMELNGVPVAVINGGVEGSSILAHLRNDVDPIDPSGIYGRLLYRAQQAGVAQGLRAVFYYQGEVDGPIPAVWASAFEDLRAGWLADLPGLERIYVMQIREGCNIPNDGVREAQRRLTELHPDVAVMSTTALPSHDLCHYYHVGYLKLGERLARKVARDLYGLPFDDVDPPRIVHAAWETPAQDALVLAFEPAGVELLLDPGCAAHTSVDDGTKVTAVSVLGPGLLRVALDGPSAATGVTWRGHAYDGPWIRNAAGVGALTFFGFPISP